MNSLRIYAIRTALSKIISQIKELGCSVGALLGDTVGAILDGITLGCCSVGVLLGDTVVRAMLDGVTLGCSVGVLLGDTVGAMLDIFCAVSRCTN